MNSGAGQLVQVATIGEIAPGECRVVEIEGHRPLALFNVEGTFYALDNECLHSGGPLGRGSLDGCVVTCPWHQWKFDVTTGELVGIHKDRCVRTFEVRLEGDAVLVNLG